LATSARKTCRSSVSPIGSAARPTASVTDVNTPAILPGCAGRPTHEACGDGAPNVPCYFPAVTGTGVAAIASTRVIHHTRTTAMAATASGIAAAVYIPFGVITASA
jgi:hypothetical protein